MLNKYTHMLKYAAATNTSTIRMVIHTMMPGECNPGAPTPMAMATPVSSTTNAPTNTSTVATTMLMAKNSPKIRMIPPVSRRNIAQMRPNWNPAESRP